MIFELKFYVNEQGYQIQARVACVEYDPQNPAAHEQVKPDFAYSGSIRYTLNSPDGQKIPAEAPLSFPIPATTKEEAFAAFPALYKQHGDVLMEQMRANIKAKNEAELRRILTT